ncbi:MAG: PH domain-containing protein [Actinobacteria bacterium]|nr:PH domain-containing protein [Actinomycetota bacterium]
MSDVQETREPVYDNRAQLQQVQEGLLDGEVVYAVYDAIGAGTGFIGITDRRVILQDKSFVGKKVAITSIPYARIISVSVVSDRTWTGGFFSTSTIAVATSEGVHEVAFRGNEKAHHAHNLILWHMVR